MKASEVITKVLDLGERAHFLIEIMQVATGKEPSPNASKMIKGFYGVLGFADERELARMLSMLTLEECTAIAGFLTWHFRNTTLSERALAWWYGNTFRTFITKMGTPERKTDDAGISFLKWMAKVIIEEPAREDGYTKLLEQFKAFGYPHIPEGIDFNEAMVFVRTTGRNTQATLIRQTRAVERRVREKEQRLSWFARFLRDLI